MPRSFSNERRVPHPYLSRRRLIQTGSTESLIEALLGWYRTDRVRLARVSYGSELSRIAALERLTERLQSESIRIQIVQLPVRKRADEVVSDLMRLLHAAPPGVVSVSGFAEAFSNHDEMFRGIQLLNYHREAIGTLPLWQIWWLSDGFAVEFQNFAPAFDEWFTFRRMLNEDFPIEELDSIEQNFGLEKSSDAESAQVAADQVRRSLTWDLKSGVHTVQSALSQCFLGANGFHKAGLVQESRLVLEELFAITAEHFGWGEGPVSEWILRALQSKGLADDAKTALTLQALAAILKRQGDLLSTRPLLERALQIRLKCFGGNHRSTILTLSNLAALAAAEGDRALAIEKYTEVIRLIEATQLQEPAWLATNIDGLAMVYRSHRQYSKAIPLAERALTIRESLNGPSHRITAISLTNLATVLRESGDHGAALPLYERALAINESTFGPEHMETATTLEHIACVLEERGDPHAAYPFLVRSLAIRENVLGPNHKTTAGSLYVLSHWFYKQKQFEEALQLCSRAAEINEKQLGLSHISTADTFNRLGLIQLALKAYDAAESSFRRATDIYERTTGTSDLRWAASINNFGTLLFQKTRYEEALQCFSLALGVADRKLRVNHPTRLSMMKNYAATLQNLGRIQEAREVARQMSIDKDSSERALDGD